MDWDYYKERLGKSIQKIIVIPSAFQKVKNPIPSVPYPEWLNKNIRESDSNFQQKKLENYFSKENPLKALLSNNNNKSEQLAINNKLKTPVKPNNNNGIVSRSNEKIVKEPEVNKHNIETNFKDWMYFRSNQLISKESLNYGFT